MKLSELLITNLRNIQSARFSFHPHINIISGANGSGKTSFLEALYLLGSGHSFRTREISALVSHAQDKLTVFAKTDNYQRVSVQKSPQLPTVARLNGEPCLSSSTLASFLPCQVFYQDIFQLIEAGPGFRRGLIDWGLFHLEPCYHAVWKDYFRVLKQRNSLLKQRVKRVELIPWDSMLADFASQLDIFRSNYFNKLILLFNEICTKLTQVSCTLHYFKGWDKKGEGRSLFDILQSSYERDAIRQYTHYGPHQADLFFTSNSFKVKHCLSRGQQKVVLFALKFAQSRLLSKECFFLIDDMTAELDEQHIDLLINFISQTKGQFFITTRLTDAHFFKFSSEDYASFLLEKGNYTPQL